MVSRFSGTSWETVERVMGSASAMVDRLPIERLWIAITQVRRSIVSSQKTLEEARRLVQLADTVASPSIAAPSVSVDAAGGVIVAVRDDRAPFSL